MKRCWGILVLAAMAAGCDPQPPSATEQRADRLAQFNQKAARLQEQLQQREARIGELQEHVGLLSGKLRQSEFTNKQLRLRLETVGPAPMERDRFKKLSEERALEIRRLNEHVRALTARLQQQGAPPTTQPAETAGGGE